MGNKLGCPNKKGKKEKEQKKNGGPHHQQPAASQHPKAAEVSNTGCKGANAGTLNVHGSVHNYFGDTPAPPPPPPPVVPPRAAPADLKDVRRDMAEMLRSRYLNAQMPRVPWLRALVMPMDTYFVHLEMASGRPHDERMSTMPLEDMFAPPVPAAPAYRVLVEGKPGYGKTTLALKLAFDWARGAEYVSSRFDLVFVVPLRAVGGGADGSCSIDDAVAKIGQVGDATGDDVVGAVQLELERVLLVLDGYDELPQERFPDLQPLLESKRWPRMTVVVTCRLGYFGGDDGENDDYGMTGAAVNQSEFWRKRVVLRGIRPQQQKEFLRKCLPEDTRSEANYVNLLNRIPDLNRDFFECPLFLLLLAVLADERGVRVPKTKTQLYKSIFNFVIRRSHHRDGLPASVATDVFDLAEGDLPPSEHPLTLLKKFGKLALFGLQTGKVYFTEREIVQACGGYKILQMGFLSKTTTLEGLYSRESFEPVHKSFLEFLSAIHLWLLFRSGKKSEFQSEVQAIRGKCLRDNFEPLVFPFLVGLMSAQAPALFEALSPASYLYSDLRPFESTLLECDGDNVSDQLLSSLTPFIPSRWSVPGFCSEWFSLSPIHSDILHYGIQIGRIVRIDWDLAHLVCLPTKFTIPELRLVVEDVSLGVDELQFAGISCDELTIEFRHVDVDNVINCWSSLTSIVTNVNAKAVHYDLGFFSAVLLPLLHREVVDGSLRGNPKVSRLTCTLDDDNAYLLNAVADLINLGSLKSVTLILNFEECEDAEDWMAVLRAAGLSDELVELDLEALGESRLPVDLNFFNGNNGADKKWKRIRLCGSFILVQTTEDEDTSTFCLSVDSLILDSVPNCCYSALRSCRIRSLTCEDSVFLPLIHDKSDDNWITYRILDRLEITVDEGPHHDHLFRSMGKLEALESLAIRIQSFDDSNLASSLPQLVSTVRALKCLKHLRLFNVHRNQAFLKSLVGSLFSSRESSSATTESSSPFALQELTIGYDRTSFRKSNTVCVQQCMMALCALLDPLSTKCLGRLVIMFGPSLQANKFWLPALGSLFSWRDGFRIDCDFGEGSTAGGVGGTNQQLYFVTHSECQREA